MKVATFNVNSIRKRLPVVTDWLAKHQPDVLCLQETKVMDELFPREELAETGYHVTFRGMKGYNGVATFTRGRPDKVIHGLVEGPDSEDFRILQTVVDGIPIINTYIPQGYAPHTEKFAYKLKWFERLRAYFEGHLDPQKPAVWLGDLNVAPEPIDVYDPVKVANDPDFHPDARAAYKKTASWGFFDVFRRLHPEQVQYTYWDFFHNRFSRNHGWRIDHIMATAPLAARCVQAEVDLEPRKHPTPSDHTVMWAEFNLS
jgi:exodeoxyribonuclease III